MASNTPKRRTTKSKATAAGEVAASAVVQSKKKRRKIDWEKIEIDYRAGIKTLREIAGEHDITHGAVNKRAKRDGWARDLSVKIQAKADELVSKALVSKVSKKPEEIEQETIDANAQAIANVKLAHRKGIRRGRDVTERLLEELEAQVGVENAQALAELGEIMRDPDGNGRDRLNDFYQKIISLPERAKTAKTLAETMRINVDMERQAFNMDKAVGQDDDPFAAMLARIGAIGSGFRPVADDPERDDDD